MAVTEGERNPAPSEGRVIGMQPETVPRKTGVDTSSHHAQPHWVPSVTFPCPHKGCFANRLALVRGPLWRQSWFSSTEGHHAHVLIPHKHRRKLNCLFFGLFPESVRTVKFPVASGGHCLIKFILWWRAGQEMRLGLYDAAYHLRGPYNST